jgi:type III secretion protein W
MTSLSVNLTEKDLVSLNHAESLNSRFSNIENSPFSLTNAAEELAFGREDDIKKRAISERDLGEYQPPVVPEIAEIDAFLQAMHDQDASAKLAARAEELITSAGRRENPLSLLRRWSRESSKQYLTLSHALQTARAKGSSQQVLGALSDAVDALVALEGEAIYADLNTVYEAQRFGNDQASTDLFRSAYRDAVMGCQHLSETLLLLLDRFGNDLGKGIAVMREALAQDLASVRPSMEPERLHLLMQDLYQLGVMSGVMQHCRLLARRLRAYRFLLLKPAPLLQDLVRWAAEPLIFGFHVNELVENYCKHSEDVQDGGNADSGEDGNEGDDGHEGDNSWNDAVGVDDSAKTGNEELQAEQLALPDTMDHDPRELFLMGAMDVLRAMPPKIFISDEHRFEAIIAVQQALDKLTGVETPT